MKFSKCKIEFHRGKDEFHCVNCDYLADSFSILGQCPDLVLFQPSLPLEIVKITFANIPPCLYDFCIALIGLKFHFPFISKELIHQTIYQPFCVPSLKTCFDKRYGARLFVLSFLKENKKKSLRIKETLQYKCLEFRIL